MSGAMDFGSDALVVDMDGDGFDDILAASAIGVFWYRGTMSGPEMVSSQFLLPSGGGQSGPFHLSH
jgi:hypothetical protein